MVVPYIILILVLESILVLEPIVLVRCQH